MMFAMGAAVACLSLVVLVRRHSTKNSSTTASPPKGHRGVTLSSISVFLAVSSAAVQFPFVQTRRDALGCDALCQGGQTSLRSGLGLVGAALIGRASDTFGRLPMLWVGTFASLASTLISGAYDTLDGMWLAIVPVALFNQNFSVAKALVSDYIDEEGGTDADKAGAVGKLGMAVGFAFMAGPVLAATMVSNYRDALGISTVGLCISAGFLLLLPKPKGGGATGSAGRGGTGETQKASGGGLLAFLSMPVLQTRGAQLLMALRLLMAFAFHMFAPLWQVSLKQRFDFQPKDHAQFMGLIGLTYALSQGLLAKPLIRKAGADPTKLLLCCIFFLGGARPFALYTSSVLVIYALYVPMVISLGVMNTAITTASSRLAEGDQLGGLFGVLESVESLAGIVGPSLGGLLAKVGDGSGTSTLAAVIGCYGAAFALVSIFFSKHVVHGAEQAKKAARKAD